MIRSHGAGTVATGARLGGAIATAVTLAETLLNHGYQTAAVVGSFVLDSRFGLDQGFQLYDDQIDTGRGGASDVSERKADEVTRRASRWLDGAPREGFFLFVHYFDPHAPCEPPEPFATAFAGDHGEGLGEHGESGHGYFIYQNTPHVPLIIKPPGRNPARIRPDFPPAHVKLAQTLMQAGRGKEARRVTLARSHAMNPTRVLTFGPLLVALAWFGTVGPARAAGTFAEAVRLEQARDYDAALAAYEAFLQAQPDAELAGTAAMAIANIELLVRRDPERAAQAYDRVLRDYTESGWGAEAARRKAECLQTLQRWSEAGEAYGRALELTGREREPHSAGWIQEVSLAAADCFYRSGERARVIATYEKALAGNLPSDAAAATLYRLADCYETNGDEAQSAARYAQILEGYPFAPVFNDALAKRELIARHRALDWALYEAFARMRAAIQGRDFAAAESLAAAIVAGSGSQALRDGTEYTRIAARMLRTGEFVEGDRQLVALAAERPNLARIYPILDQRMQFYAAAAGMQAGLRANPGNADGWRAFGELVSRAGAVEPAVDALERAAALDPGNPDTALQLGYAYAAASRFAEAAQAFDLYLERNPQDAATCNQIGYTYLAVNRPEQALPYFQRYATLAPDEANAHDSFGEGLMRAGRLAEAAVEYETAIRLEPGFANPYFMLGEINRELGDRAKAAAAYTRFIELASGDDRAADARTRLKELD